MKSLFQYHKIDKAIFTGNYCQTGVILTIYLYVYIYMMQTLPAKWIYNIPHTILVVMWTKTKNQSLTHSGFFFHHQSANCTVFDIKRVERDFPFSKICTWRATTYMTHIHKPHRSLWWDNFYVQQSFRGISPDLFSEIAWQVKTYRKVSNIRCTLVCNKIVDHSDVVGASPVDDAPTTSSFSP